MIKRSHRLRRQRGVALPIGLIILMVMTIIGVAAIQTTSLDEKMAGNETDRNRAFQAAEAALRDAESELVGSGRKIFGLVGFTESCGSSTTAGLCYNGPAGYSAPIWTTVSMTSAPSVAYHQFTNPSDTTSFSELSARPRYLIEGFRKNVPGWGLIFYYRITARAQGASPNTVVWLQTVFRP